MSTKPGELHTTEYVRNAAEEPTEIIDPLRRKIKKEYNNAGDLTRIEDPSEIEERNTYLGYDSANRLTSKSYSDEKTPHVEYEYDGNGDLTRMTDGTGKTTYTYDILGRLTSTTNGHGETTSYEYDLANEQTKITYPNKHQITRTYDQDGRLQTVTDWLGNQTKFTYDPDSNLTATTFPSSTNEQDQYGYNAADQLTQIKMSKGTETLAYLTYTRDNDGQVTNTTSKGLPGEEKTGYTYDPNNRLIQAGATTYGYDAANNPIKLGSSLSTYDNADELKTTTGTKYTYDTEGQRTKATPSGAATTYGYDQAGNLIAVERPAEGKNPQIKDTYTYNGNGLRAS
jgi:YD repeat-containing protein